jgi:hypothetical protein
MPKTKPEALRPKLIPWETLRPGDTLPGSYHILSALEVQYRTIDGDEIQTAKALAKAAKALAKAAKAAKLGRPSMWGPRQAITVAMPVSVLGALDGTRGDIPRQAWIVDCLARALSVKKG